MLTTHEEPLSPTNFSTLEYATPTHHQKRGSFSGWTDDVISILKKYPQKKDCQTPHNGRELIPEPKNTFKPYKTMADMKEKIKGFRIKKEASSNIVRSGEMSSKRSAQKTTRKAILEDTDRRYGKEVFDEEVEGYSPKVCARTIINQKKAHVQDLKVLNCVKESDNNRESPTSNGNDRSEDKNVNNFYPKLKPKQIAVKTKDVQNVTIVIVAANTKPSKHTVRKRDISASSVKDVVFEEEIQGYKKTADDESHRLNTSEVSSPNKTSSVPVARKIPQLKSFNNANLKYGRKNFMGMSMLSTVTKETHSKNKSLLDKIPPEASLPTETARIDDLSHVQAFRQYLERITRPNKNAMGMFKEKLYSAYGPPKEQSSYGQEISDRKPVQKSTKSRSIAGMGRFIKTIKETSPKKLETESPKGLYTYEEIMVGNCMKVVQAPAPKENAKRFKYSTDLVLQEDQYDSWQ